MIAPERSAVPVISLVFVACFALHCASAPSLPGTAASSACANFEGTYQYPGWDGLETACGGSASEWGSLHLPWPIIGPIGGGFWAGAAQPHPIKVSQVGCDQIRFDTLINFRFIDDGPRGHDEPREIALDLTPARSRKVIWGENTVFWRQKFIPAGFRTPFRRAFMEVRLTLLEDGSLEYYLRHEERWRTRAEIRCRWPRVAAEEAAPPPGR